MNTTVMELLEAAEGNNILNVIKPFGHNLKVRIPVSNAFCNLSIDALDLSIRSRNGLMRAGLNNC